jgi:RTX calcium-binding nonapeptide repeat (4 copies)
MRARRLAVGGLASCAALPAAGAAPADTSHDGWPPRTGVLRINKDDGNDTTRGTGRNDELLGGHGSDTIYGRRGSDVIWGDYKPSGQTATQVDHLYGGSGNEFIYASHGRNFIVAGAGNDSVHAHFGRGSVDCGSGRDVLFISHRSRPGYHVRHCERISYKTLGH